jgi:uncharacterized protein YutE (UPF0331/DUF86 family)
MILRKDVVQERLAFLRSTILRLDPLRLVDRDQFMASEHLQWQAERGLQLGAQAVLDVGAHIVTGHFNKRPAGYEEVIRLLGEHRVISDELQAALAGLGGFRNVLVHGYLEIDEERVFKFLQRDSLAFREFANVIDRWLEQHA